MPPPWRQRWALRPARPDCALRSLLPQPPLPLPILLAPGTALLQDLDMGMGMRGVQRPAAGRGAMRRRQRRRAAASSDDESEGSEDERPAGRRGGRAAREEEPERGMSKRDVRSAGLARPLLPPPLSVAAAPTALHCAPPAACASPAPAPPLCPHTCCPSLAPGAGIRGAARGARCGARRAGGGAGG